MPVKETDRAEFEAFGDLGFLVMNKRLIDRDFYRLGADFPWIIPSGVMLLVLAPALLIALLARIRGSVRLGVPVGLLSFVGFLDEPSLNQALDRSIS